MSVFCDRRKKSRNRLLLAIFLCIILSQISTGQIIHQGSEHQHNYPIAEGASDDRASSEPSSTCQKKSEATTWTRIEKFAWSQICANQPIDLRNYADPTSSATDDTGKRKNPHLSPLFIKQIFEFPDYAIETKNRPVKLIGAYLKTLTLSNVEISSLVFELCDIDQIDLHNITIRYNLSFVDSSVNYVSLISMHGGSINIDQSGFEENFEIRLGKKAIQKNAPKEDPLNTIKHFVLKDSNVDAVQLRKYHIDELWIFNSEVKNILSIGGGLGLSSLKRTELSNLKVGHFLLRSNRAYSIKLRNVINSSFFLISIDDWDEDSWLDLENAEIKKFIYRDEKVPTHVRLDELSFASADWSNNPLPLLRQFEKASKTKTLPPVIYTNLAKAYREKGQVEISRSILIASQNAAYHNTSSIVEKAYLTAAWAFVGYGFRPEFGFIWIAGFVVIGSIVFRTGHSRVIGEFVPRSWLLFSIDSVIPGIELDKGHKDLRFEGWRQHYLYFMRLLGAVVVVLALQLIKQVGLGI